MEELATKLFTGNLILYEKLSINLLRDGHIFRKRAHHVILASIGVLQNAKTRHFLLFLHSWMILLFPGSLRESLDTNRYQAHATLTHILKRFFTKARETHKQ